MTENQQDSGSIPLRSTQGDENMKAPKKFNGIRLDKNNIKDYLSEKYNTNRMNVSLLYDSTIILSDFEPLVQDDYGLAGDCAITSIAAVAQYYFPHIVTKSCMYGIVEYYGRHFFYRGDKWGTPIPFIGIILKKSLLSFTKEKINVTSLPCKNLFAIKKQLQKSKPVILSILNDGRNCYKNHTVTIVGYEQFKVGKKSADFLIVYDNWDREYHYVDYAALNLVSPIVY